MSLLLRISSAEDAGLENDSERTVAEVATSVNGEIQEKGISLISKYPVEPPGSGTSSREAIKQPKQKEWFETPSENVGDGDLMSMSVP